MILSELTDSALDHYMHKWQEMIHTHVYVWCIDIANTNPPGANIRVIYVTVSAYLTQQSCSNPMSQVTTEKYLATSNLRGTAGSYVT